MLTNGNIDKKSNRLKYFILHTYQEDPDSVFHERTKVYRDLINKKYDLSKYLEIVKNLHDSNIIKIETIKDTVTIKLELYDEDDEEKMNCIIDFLYAKIISCNVVSKSGKICRLNQKITPKEYLYEEFTIEGKEKFITILFTTENKIRKGNGNALMTIRFEDMRVREKV